MSKKLLRPDQVADILSVGISTVYELVRNGELIAHCPNGPGTKPMKITADSVDDYYQKYLVSPSEWAK